MAINDVDKAKIRTAVKCYLKFKQNASAKELYYFIASCNLKLRGRLNPNILGTELTYCCNPTKPNFLNLGSYRDKTNTKIYYLED